MKSVRFFLLTIAVGLSLTGAGTASAFSFGNFSFSDDDWGPNWGDGTVWQCKGHAAIGRTSGGRYWLA